MQTCQSQVPQRKARLWVRPVRLHARSDDEASHRAALLLVKDLTHMPTLPAL